MNNQLRHTLPITMEEFPIISSHQLQVRGIYGVYRNGGINNPNYSRYFVGFYRGFDQRYGHGFYMFYQKELSNNWRLLPIAIYIEDTEINDLDRWIIYELPEYFRIIYPLPEYFNNNQQAGGINSPDSIFSQHKQENYAINSNNSNIVFNSMARNSGSNVGTGSGISEKIASYLGPLSRGGKKKRKTKKLRKGKKRKSLKKKRNTKRKKNN